jgi:hypothetical protein
MLESLVMVAQFDTWHCRFLFQEVLVHRANIVNWHREGSAALWRHQRLGHGTSAGTSPGGPAAAAEKRLHR